ncbi:MAG: hypothetical protein KA371_11330 [Acidobacteria bacterium]|nr:hypothetical protein [Acidobacteriota bacterium]
MRARTVLTTLVVLLGVVVALPAAAQSRTREQWIAFGQERLRRAGR